MHKTEDKNWRKENISDEASHLTAVQSKNQAESRQGWEKLFVLKSNQVFISYRSGRMLVLNHLFCVQNPAWRQTE